MFAFKDNSSFTKEQQKELAETIQNYFLYTLENDRKIQEKIIKIVSDNNMKRL